MSTQLEVQKNKWREASRRHYQNHREAKIQLNNQRDRKIRSQAIQKLGSVCENCGVDKKLQLHHRYYAKDSVRPKVHREPGTNSRKRNLEAIEHPERFRLLCLSCHNHIEPRMKKSIPLGIWFDRQEEMKQYGN